LAKEELPPPAPEVEEDIPIEEYPDELDEAGIDLFLQKEEPDFTSSLKSIGADKTLIAQDISLSDEQQQLADEVEAWKTGSKFRRMVLKVVPFAPRLSLIKKRLQFKVALIVHGRWVRFKNFGYYLATDGRQKAVASTKSWLSEAAGSVASGVSKFKSFPILKKVLAASVLLIAVLTTVFIYRSYTHGIIQPGEELFIPSLESVATESYDYDPATESEPFYDNLRSTQNLFLFPKMVVNLARGNRPNRNPMAAFEFFVEGMVPEVIVEMKDREAMIKDAMQRTIEGYSFEQLDTSEGKNELREKLMKEINSLLTKGAVRRVLIKTIVLKP
jgi:flagellar basal body-associated protein FliL